MFTSPLTPSLNTQVAQRTINAWDTRLTGLSGGCGGKCSCDGKCSGGLGDMVSDAGPFTSLIVHLAMAGLAISLFKYAFLSPSSGYGARRASIARAEGAVTKARARRPKLHPL